MATRQNQQPRANYFDQFDPSTARPTEGTHTDDKDPLGLYQPAKADDVYDQMQSLYGNSHYDQLLNLALSHLQQHPQDVTALNFFGLALSANGEKANARKVFSKAIELSPEDAILYYNLAITYDTVAELPTSINIPKKAQQLDPGNKLISDNLSQLQERVQRISSERQQAKSPANPDAYFNQDIKQDCKIKPVMTDEEKKRWLECSSRRQD